MPTASNLHRVNELVNRQVRTWAFSRLAITGDEPEKQALPVITVSREHGARGAALGRGLAEHMGYQLWDREIVKAIAARGKETRDLLETLDEHAQSAVEEFIGDILGGHARGQGYYVHQVNRLIQNLASKGAVILVGRGAEYIVPPDRALRIRCVCDRDARIEGIADRQGLTLDQARQRVECTDRDRAHFIRDNYGKQTGSPTDYDLVLNTGTLPVDALIPTVLAALSAKFDLPDIPDEQ